MLSGIGGTTEPSVESNRWQTFRLFLMPFCVSSFSALIKGQGYILILPSRPLELCVSFLLRCRSLRMYYWSLALTIGSSELRGPELRLAKNGADDRDKVLKTSAKSLSLRITVVDPPPGLLWALQLGRDEVVKPTFASKTRISFDFTVNVVEDSSPAGFRLRGPAVQGRPGERFVYLRMGAYAGQSRRRAAGWRAKDWARRHKSRASGSGAGKTLGRVEVQFVGTGPKGGPACATVPLLGSGWHVK